MKAIGLMSGTSMDGIDVAVLETDGTSSSVKSIAKMSVSYDSNYRCLLKGAEKAIRESKGNIVESDVQFLDQLKSYLTKQLCVATYDLPCKLDELSQYLESYYQRKVPLTLSIVIEHSTHLHADAVKQLLTEQDITADQIDIIGYHGQAFYHQPDDHLSVVLGDGKLLASLTGINVVNDFRSQDIAVGGQGAPFAPLYHQALAVRDNLLPCVVLNIGGISNITIIRNENEHDLLGYDTGPGNCLLDQLVGLRTAGRESMDCDGHYALNGTVNQTELEALYQHSTSKKSKNYFLLPPPKSLDYGDMKLLPQLSELSLNDAAATVADFTAMTIVDSLQYCDFDVPNRWIIAGGGSQNPAILSALRRRLSEYYDSDFSLATADEVTWDGKALEAELFAYLAVRSREGLPLSYPGTTQVPVPICGGTFHAAKEIQEQLN